MAAGSRAPAPPGRGQLWTVKVEDDSPGDRGSDRLEDWPDPETSRLQFRQLRYREVAGPEQALSRLRALCRGWLRPERRSKEQMLELLVLEQFLAILPEGLQACVRDRRPASGEEAAALVQALQRALDGSSSQELVTSEDAAEPLTWEEWEHLGTARKDFCRESSKDYGSTVLPGLETRAPNIELIPKEEIVKEGKPQACLQETWQGKVPRLSECSDAHEDRVKGQPSSVVLLKHRAQSEDRRPTDMCPMARASKEEGGSENNEFGTSADLVLAQHIQVAEGPLGGDEHRSTCRLSFHVKCPGVKSEDTVDSTLGPAERQRREGEDRPYQCDRCKKSFRQRSDLLKHQRIHTGEKPYPCQACGKSFSQSAALIKHQRTHTGEKPYHCLECGERFRQSSHLSRHQRTHARDKYYRCEECGQLCHISSLFRHQRLHRGERPYPCEDCNKCFKQRSDLFKHQRTHTGEKPYGCLVCGKSFSQSATLIKHQRTHTGEKPYHCLQCGESFRQSTHLIRHQRIHRNKVSSL